MKEKSIKALKNDLWKVTSKIVRIRYPVCYTCGKILDFNNRNAGHFWTKGGHGAAKYEFDNLRTQCLSCNNFKSGNLAEYQSRLRKEIGEDRFDDLERLAKSTRKYTREQLKEMISDRKILLSNLIDE